MVRRRAPGRGSAPAASTAEPSARDGRSPTVGSSPYLIGVTVGLALLSGFVVTLVDREDFPTFGTGIWWSIVTLGTIGYGDVVPHTLWGRVIGSVVIVVGVTFLSFLTATVTSYFVSTDQEGAEERERQRTEALAEGIESSLGRVEQRLDAIEKKLAN